MNKTTLYVVLASTLLASSAARACGGGGAEFRAHIDSLAVTKDVYSVANHILSTGTSGVAKAGSVVFGAVNGMLFGLAEFFSEEENVEDFGKGVQHLKNLKPGQMGKPSWMSDEEFEEICGKYC